MASRVFAYDVDRRFLPLCRLFGFRPRRDGVRIDDAALLATFGFARIETPRDNVTEAHITRNYRWWTACGARRSFVDDGLSFGTNNRAGVCIHFREKVPSRLSRRGHSALTVTVTELEELTRILSSAPPAADNGAN